MSKQPWEYEASFYNFDGAYELAVAEIERLREELRLREESQIPIIPRGAQAELERLQRENSRRDVVLDWITANAPRALELCPYKLWERR